MQAESIAHPPKIEVAVCGGRHKVIVRPWTMAQRHELRPRLIALLERVEKFPEEGPPSRWTLPKFFAHAEEELIDLAQYSAELPDGLVWGDLWWEDGASIVQAAWELNFVRVPSGGLVGKVASAIGAAIARLYQAAAQTPESSSESSEKTKTPENSTV